MTSTSGAYGPERPTEPMEVVWHRYNNPGASITSEVVRLGNKPSGFPNTPATPYVVVISGDGTEMVTPGMIEDGSPEVLKHVGKRPKNQRAPRLVR